VPLTVSLPTPSRQQARWHPVAGRLAEQVVAVMLRC